MQAGEHHKPTPAGKQSPVSRARIRISSPYSVEADSRTLPPHRTRSESLESSVCAFSIRSESAELKNPQRLGVPSGLCRKEGSQTPSLPRWWASIALCLCPPAMWPPYDPKTAHTFSASIRLEPAPFEQVIDRAA